MVWRIREAPAVVYPASEVGSVVARADMASASSVRRCIPLDHDGCEHRIELRDVMLIGAGHGERQGDAAVVHQQVTLAASFPRSAKFSRSEASGRARTHVRLYFDHPARKNPTLKVSTCGHISMSTLLLEDDLDLGEVVFHHLSAAGHRVHWCKLLAQAREAEAVDLALLDLGLPDGDGLSLLREWRSAGRRLPVIVLTARDQVSDRIRGLQAGADDYLVKPFDLDEMLARIDAVRRRTERRRADRGVRRTTMGVSLDLSARVAQREGQPIELTAMEWAVLALIARQPGRIFSRSSIEAELLGRGLAEGDSNSLEVIVSRLRKKLGASAISTHRGLGYRFDV